MGTSFSINLIIFWIWLAIAKLECSLRIIFIGAGVAPSASGSLFQVESIPKSEIVPPPSSGPVYPPFLS